MSNLKEQPFNGPCPDCGSEIECYDTEPDEKSGKYRCTHCGRDTIWKQSKAISAKELFGQLMSRH